MYMKHLHYKPLFYTALNFSNKFSSNYFKMLRDKEVLGF